MKISYNLLKQFIKIDWKSDETADLLTDLGLEVEAVKSYHSIPGGLEGVVVGHVLKCVPHPNADTLSLAIVDLGQERGSVQIVCGAPNIAEGQKVAVACEGTTLYDEEKKAFQIKKSKIRGEESMGMICSEAELGLSKNHEGILVLDSALKSGASLAKILKIEQDEIFEIGLTPNRADAMSHLGVARDLRAGLSQANVTLELITPPISSFRVDKRTLKIDVVVEDKKMTPRYAGVTISDVTVKPSPQWLQNRLHAIGIIPKNNIVDVTNYVLHELGQPMHAFDSTKLDGNKIVVKTAEAGTKFITLDGVERTLHEEDLMIYNSNQPVAIAGILGGIHSGVTATTRNIFLESAYFDPITIRKTAKRHGLSTDASFRFERGIDPNITIYALKRAALLIKEVAGGEVTSEIIDLYPKKIEDFSVFLNFDYVTKVIGEELSKETIKNILASLDIKINNISEVGLGLSIPSYRVDVQREIDLIEEILRIYGYNTIRFTKKLHATTFNSSRTEEHKIQTIIANQLVSLGFYEIMCNSLSSKTYHTWSQTTKEAEDVVIVNPLSNDLAVMRQSLLYSGLEAILFNTNRKKTDLKLFEFGKSYHKLDSGYEEKKHLTLFLTGNKSQEYWANGTKTSDFFLFKGYVKTVFERLGLVALQTLPISVDFFEEGIAIAHKNQTLVSLGSVHKNILKHFGIKQEVFFADFDWDLIVKLVSTKMKYVEPSKYPEVRRDLALLIDKKVSFEEVYRVAKESESSLLKEINLFDVYEGDKIPKDKKSYAISFIIQDHKKTLTDKQIGKIMLKIQESLEKKLGAILRS